ncbi:hypothetical protein ON010_g6775 [Phytophthora cinnamomi]|nr:hypothetical protein ON010_g6775 [Phytophthora cinnamomi]
MEQGASLAAHSRENHVNLKKASLKLQQSSTEPHHYALEFQFDATKPCRISVFLVATETISADTGSSSFALVHADKNPVLTQHFPSGLGQTFVLKGGANEEDAAKEEEDQEKLEQPLPLLDFSSYEPDELVYKPGAMQFPLVVVLEVSSARKRPQSQSTFCTFVKKGGDTWEVKMLKQKILVDGLTYELQEIYGIDGTVTAAPKTERSGAAGEGQADATQAPKEEIEIPEGAECIICLLSALKRCIRVEAKETTTTEAEEDTNTEVEDAKNKVILSREILTADSQENNSHPRNPN